MYVGVLARPMELTRRMLLLCRDVRGTSNGVPMHALDAVLSYSSEQRYLSNGVVRRRTLREKHIIIVVTRKKVFWTFGPDSIGSLCVDLFIE